MIPDARDEGFAVLAHPGLEIVSSTAAFRSILGIEAGKEPEGLALTDLLDFGDIDLFRALLEDMVSSDSGGSGSDGRTVSSVCRLRRDSVTSRDSVSVEFRVLSSSESRVELIAHLVSPPELQDTEDRELLSRLEKSSFRTLLDHINDGFAIQDESGIRIYANDRLCEMTGYTKEELIGRHGADLLDEANAAILREQTEKRSKEPGEQYDLVLPHRDGGRVHVIVAPSVIRDSSGKYLGSAAVLTDITSRKATEKKLRGAVSRLEFINTVLTRILTTAHSLVARRDLDDLLQQIAVAAQEALGFETVLVNLVDEETGDVRMSANVGLDPEEKRLLEEPTVRMTWESFKGILDDRYRTGSCYFIPHGEIDWSERFDLWDPMGKSAPEAAAEPEDATAVGPQPWHPQDALICLIGASEGGVAGMISVDRPSSGFRPDLGTLQCLEIFADLAAVLKIFAE